MRYLHGLSYFCLKKLIFVALLTISPAKHEALIKRCNSLYRVVRRLEWRRETYDSEDRNALLHIHAGSKCLRRGCNRSSRTTQAAG